jgi:hypothetical protein
MPGAGLPDVGGRARDPAAPAGPGPTHREPQWTAHLPAAPSAPRWRHASAPGSPELIERLGLPIAPPRVCLLRFQGVLAPRSRLRSDGVPRSSPDFEHGGGPRRPGPAAPETGPTPSGAAGRFSLGGLDEAGVRDRHPALHTLRRPTPCRDHEGWRHAGGRALEIPLPPASPYASWRPSATCTVMARSVRRRVSNTGTVVSQGKRTSPYG